MKHRVKSLWLPGLVISFASVAWLKVLDRVGLKLLIRREVIGDQSAWFEVLDRAGQEWVHISHLPLTIFIPVGQTLYLDLFWLLALPLLGALGAWWSKRAGGGPWERALAGISPASPLAVVCLGVLPVALVVDSHVPLHLLLSGFGVTLLNWSLIPGVALFLGALPFLKRGCHSVRHAGI